MKLITRKEAIEQGLRRFFTGKACLHGHIAERYASSNNCVICLITWSRRNHSKYAQASNDWQKSNRAHMREYHKKWREENKERWRELMKRSNAKRRLKRQLKKEHANTLNRTDLINTTQQKEN
jgi:hypothetical protein